MSRTTVVRYTARPEAADANQRLIEQVFAQLAREEPSGVQYAVFRLEDGVTFVHVAVVEGDSSPLTNLSAFADYLRDINGRLVEPATNMTATLIGSYHLLQKQP